MQSLKRIWNKTVQYFVPESFRQGSPIDRRRAELAIKISLFLAFWGPLFAWLYYILAGAVAQSLVMLGATVLMLAVPFVLRATGRLDIAGNVLIIPIFFGMFVLSFWDGGIEGPSLNWVALLPVMALIFGGDRSGKAWLILVVVFVCGLFFVDHVLDVEFPGEQDSREQELMYVFSLVGLDLIVFYSVRLKDDIQQWLIDSLRDARDEALEASRAKSRFLAKMSHELRTPLNAVIGYSEMIEEEFEFMSKEDEAVRQVAEQFGPDLERIYSAGRHLLAIIDDILDLSKIEAGQMDAKLQDFEVDDLLEEVVQTAEPLAAENGNTLAVEIDGTLGQMHSDRSKVRQILLNLVSNACKFTHDGRVEIHAKREQNAGVDQLVFEVSDTGIGMSEDELDLVFDAFVQADNSTTREYEGTGLGLTIVRHFCALLAGDVKVESTPGEGSTFRVRLDASMHANN